MILSACKKNNTGTGGPDYTAFKIKKAIHYLNGSVDTSDYIYTGDTIAVRIHAKNSATVYTSKYFKTGDQITFQRFLNDKQDMTGFYLLNNKGYTDTSRLSFIPSGTINNYGRSYYNEQGFQTRDITNYIQYVNDVKKFYNNGDCSYWIYDFTYQVAPFTKTKDSVVFEYYTDLPLHVNFASPITDFFGKSNTHLVKKRTYYNLLNSNTISTTYEYSYNLNEIGLVTAQFYKIYNQPGNVLARNDSTFYTY